MKNEELQAHLCCTFFMLQGLLTKWVKDGGGRDSWVTSCELRRSEWTGGWMGEGGKGKRWEYSLSIRSVGIDERLEKGWRGLYTNGGMVKAQHQMSVGQKIRTRWWIMQHTYGAFTSYWCLTYYCHSFLLFFVLEKKRKTKKENTQIFFLQATKSSDCLISPFDHLWSPFPFLSSITALALLRISSASSEAHRRVWSLADTTTVRHQKLGAGGRRHNHSRLEAVVILKRKEANQGIIGGLHFSALLFDL